jgi:hypothetical protein
VPGRVTRWARRQRLRLLWLLFWLSCGGVLFVVWWVPKIEVNPWRGDLPQVEELAAEDAIRRTLAQIVGGAFVLLGLYFTLQNVIINREGRITDRFSKAIDQLGSEQMAVRLGAIYALERIGRDSGKDHWTIVETLCAFIRENTRAPSPEDGEPAPRSPRRPGSLPATPLPRADVQAACTVLGRRNRKHPEPGRIHLPRVHLEGLTLHEEHHFEEAVLFRAVFDGANLSRVHTESAILFLAKFRGANLAGAFLTGAQMLGADFERAALFGAHLEGASLDNAHLQTARLDGARLEGTRLNGTHLEGASLLDAHGLTVEQIRSAIIDDKTKLPPEIAAALRAPAETASEGEEKRTR